LLYPDRWKEAWVTAIWARSFERHQRNSNMPCWKRWGGPPRPVCSDKAAASGSALPDLVFPGFMSGWTAGRNTTNISLTAYPECPSYDRYGSQGRLCRSAVWPWLLDRPAPTGQELPLRKVNQGAPEQSFSWALTAASLVKTPNRRIKRRSCHCSRYTPPLHKLAHQGMLVDRFDFWLTGHEDPDATKGSQYARWHKLCDVRNTMMSNH
jgi:hypothetical protein